VTVNAIVRFVENGPFSIENSLDDRIEPTNKLILSITYLARSSDVILDVCLITSRVSMCLDPRASESNARSIWRESALGWTFAKLRRNYVR